jgi:N-carbamoylputrescine amidase
MPRLALLQSKTFATKTESLEHHEQLIRDAAAGGANIIVTQELFLTPYFCTLEDPSLFDLADPLPGPITDRLGKLAGELGIVLISSLFEHRGPGLYHNTAAIHDADGSLMGLYRKSTTLTHSSARQSARASTYLSQYELNSHSPRCVQLY